MKVKALVETVKIISQNDFKISAEVKVKNIKPVLKRFGKLDLKKSFTGYITRNYDVRWPIEKGTEIILTDEELKDLITPLEFEDFLMIPDKYGLIKTGLRIRQFKNIPGSSITLITSHNEKLAELILDPDLEKLCISFSSFKGYTGPVMVKELNKQLVGYIASESKVELGLKFQGNSDQFDKNLVTKMNQYLKLKVNPEKGARLEGLEVYNSDCFDFFSYFPMYRKTSDLYLMGIGSGIAGENVLDPILKKFKPVPESNGKFSLKKKGYLFTREYSFFKKLPITNMKFKVKNISKKDKEFSVYYNADLFFSLKPEFKRLTFRDLDGAQNFNFSHVWMFWDGNHYYKVILPILNFYDKKTKDIITLIWNSQQLKEVSIGSDHFGLRLKYIDYQRKLKPEKTVVSDLFIIQGKLVYTGKDMLISVPGKTKTILISIPTDKKADEKSIKNVNIRNNQSKSFKQIKLFKGFNIRVCELDNEFIKEAGVFAGKRKIRIKQK